MRSSSPRFVGLRCADRALIARPYRRRRGWLTAVLSAWFVMGPGAARGSERDGCGWEGREKMKQARRADDDGDKDRMKRLYVEARDHFQSDISRDECQKSLASLKRDLGMVFVGLHKATGEGRYACEAAQNIRQANELRPETGAVEPADVSLESLDDDCKRSLAPDHTRQWILTGASVGALAAGALMLVLALDAQEEREAADARFYASLPGSAEERRALADFDDASGRTDVLGIAGYAATLAGVALAGWAIYAWVNEAPGEARVVIGVRPGGLVVEARF